MFAKKTNLLEGYPNKKGVNPVLLTVIGVFLLCLLLFSVFYTSSIERSHLPKISLLDNAKLELTFAYLDFNKKVALETSEISSIKTLNHLNNVKTSLNKFKQDPTWNYKFLATNEINEAEIIFKILNNVQALDKINHQPLTQKSVLAYKNIFYVVVKELDKLDNDLNTSLLSESNLFSRIQIFLLGVFLLYVIFAIVIIKKSEKQVKVLFLKQRQLLERLEKSNSYLEESQKIAKAGYYAYNFKTKTFKASHYILNILGLSEDEDMDLNIWIDCIHIDDRSILTTVLSKRLIDPTIPLDVTYRIIRPIDGGIRWIHHIASTPKKDKNGDLLNVIGAIQDITEQKEAALKSARFNQIMESTLNEIFIIDFKTAAIIDVNDSVLFNLEYSKAEILKFTVPDFAPELTPERLDNLREALNHEKTVVFETYQKRKNGSTYSVEMHVQKGNHLDIEAFLVVVIDITERKESEQLLHDTEKRWKLAIESTSDGLWDMNFKTNSIYYSKRWKEMLGYQEHEIENTIEVWQKLVHPDDLERVERTSSLHYNQKTISFSAEYRMLCKDGSYKWILDRAKVVERDADNKPVRAIGVHTDISERKLAESIIKTHEAELLNAQKIAKLGSYNLDLTTMLGNCSEIFGKITELNTTNLVDFHKEWRALVHPDDVEGNQKALENSIKTGKKFERDYRIITKKTKTLKWIHSLGEIIFKDNKPTNFIGTIQDITERKLAEEKLKQASAILNQIDSLVIVEDADFNTIYVSPNVKDILGYNESEMLGQGWWHLTFDNQKMANLSKEKDRLFFETHDSKTAFISSRKIKTKNGDFKWIEWHITKGNDNTYISVGMDVTERHREAQTKEVIHNISREVRVGISLEALFNFIRTELAKLVNTQNFFIAIYDEKTDMISTPYMIDEVDNASDFPKGKTLTGSVIDAKKSLLVDEKALKKYQQNNKRNWVGPIAKCWLGIPLLINNEAIGAIVLQSYTDVNAYTQKDVALLELMASNISQVIKQSKDFEKINLLNQALIQSPESVLVTNTKGEIEYVNPAFTTLSGYSEKEALGKTPRILKSGEQVPKVYEDLWKTITDGKSWEGELINQHKDGTNYLVAANIAPVKNKKGEITHYIGVEEDITEKRKLERNFIHAFIDAQEQEKQSFGEDLHDGISQILAAEAMYIDVLMRLDKKDDKKVTGFLTKIRALNLNATNDARNLAHGLMSKQLKESGLLKAVEHICIDYSHSRNINFSFKHKDLKESDFNKDIKTNIFRIIQEVSTNTIRHSLAKKATVEMTKENKNSLKLVIKDDGVGIDFEKMKRDNKGAGLKNIERRVTLLRGKLNLESEPDKGTCYTIIVPLKAVS